jgi:hypothetical protein
VPSEPHHNVTAQNKDGNAVGKKERNHVPSAACFGESFVVLYIQKTGHKGKSFTPPLSLL